MTRDQLELIRKVLKEQREWWGYLAHKARWRGAWDEEKQCAIQALRCERLRARLRPERELGASLLSQQPSSPPSSLESAPETADESAST